MGKRGTLMTSFKVTVDARPVVWADTVEFIESPERGKSARSKIVSGKEHDPDELVPDSLRCAVRHREWRHIQDHTTPGKSYEVFWVHGQFVDVGHSGGKKRFAHYESWFLIVDDGGNFMDVPATICAPVA
jgi:hypothetical protein